ncbi:cobaltochelatase subunit CobN [Desulfolithobacter sp.]
MQPFTLCCFSAGGMELPSLSRGVLAFRERGGRITVRARTRDQLVRPEQRKAFVQDCLAADVVIISLHGGKPSFPAWEELIMAMKAVDPASRPHLHIQPSGGDEDSLTAAAEHSHAFGTPTWDTINQYLSLGGHVNFCQLFFYLHNLLFGFTLACRPPLRLPDEGIYHPDLDGVPELADYLERLDPAKPTVGLWFYQTYWLNDNLAFIDALIRAIEAQGANVLPVFHLRYRDADRGNHGADYIVDHFFLDGDRPRIQVLINPMLFSLSMAGSAYEELLPRLGVPCIQALVSMGERAAWQESDQGMTTADVSFSAAQPEFDGNLITVPVAFRELRERDPITGGLLARYEPHPERIDKLVRLALNWARLGRIPVDERRVAIIFHHYPPRDDRIGCAAGLDSFASVVRLLDRMRAEGYRIEHDFKTGDNLARALLDRVTADRRWLTPERMAARAEATAGPEHYLGWNRELPAKVRDKMERDWGEVPGELFVHDGRMLFAGFVSGNIFLTIQPPRGYLEHVDAIYHDLHLSTPHHYLAQYRYIRDVFGAHAVIHVGKHGSLEWLPGKALGLSDHCYPDLAIMELPNIYPYIINDPSEGTQAKRRSFACIIDHLTPAFTNAELAEDLATVERLLQEYAVATSEDPGKVEILRSMLWEAVEAADLHHDLELDRKKAFADFDAFLERLHAYLSELADTMINDGLHVFGQPPEGERLVEFLAQLTRLDNGPVPSLRGLLLQEAGHDPELVLANRGRVLPAFDGRTGGELIAAAHEKALVLLHNLAMDDFDPDLAAKRAAEFGPQNRARAEQVLAWICKTLVPNIRGCTDEIGATLTALGGGFVRPGPSGAPSRGQADILPTGRNFFSVDPAAIPTPAAWEVGKRLGDELIERYLAETGDYPDSVGILVYGGPTMRSRGDDIAEIYYLMGLRPVWQAGSGRVTGLEVIPLAELGRPRLDVVPRVSGFFRDAFPNLMEQIDEAVAMVSALNEPPESNILRRNVESDMAEYLRQGMSDEEARREATLRVFGCPPGTYGAGVSELVESKNWQDRQDLAANYIRYSAHAYGRGTYGQARPQTFRRLLARMDVTVKNEDSREYDMMSCTDYYNYYGGLIAAAATVRGRMPASYMGDSSDPEHVRVRTTAEEAKHVLRARLVNPKWLEGMRRHGYKGAGDISHMMDVVFGWDATADVIDDWMYEKIAEKYALDPAMQEWMRQVNPHALENILNKLLEAIGRGMWQAEAEMEEKLRDAYLDMEGEIEERTE